MILLPVNCWSVLKPNFFLYCAIYYSKTCVKRPLSKRPEIGSQALLSLNAGQKYCRMLQGEHSAIHSTFIKLLFVIKVFVLLIFSGCFTQVLLYIQGIFFWNIMDKNDSLCLFLIVDLIMSAPFRVGKHIVFPWASVCLSVCHKSFPLYNLKTA